VEGGPFTLVNGSVALAVQQWVIVCPPIFCTDVDVLRGRIQLRADESHTDGARDHRLEAAIEPGPVPLVECLLADIEAWHQAVPQQVTQAEGLIHIAVLVDEMVCKAQDGLIGQRSSKM